MNFKSRFRLIFALLAVSVCIFTSFKLKEVNSESASRELIDKIFEAVENVKTVRYNLQCNERIKGRMQHTESKVKLQISPRKLYLNIRGVEVLWVQGQNKG